MEEDREPGPGTEEVVRAYIDACNGIDLERVLALLDPDVELREADALPGAVTARGIAEVRRYLERFGTHWSSFHWDPLELHVSGERALMLARLHLEGRESGIAVERDWYYVFVVRDGKLLRQDGYDDERSAQQAFSAPS